jgi:hypothetical protein
MKKLIIILLIILLSGYSYAGNPQLIGSGGSGTGDVATDTIWDAAGDTVYGTGPNTSARLPAGTGYQLFMMNSGATAPAWTSTLGVTGTRLTKIWTTDIESTNMVTVGGSSLATIFQGLDSDLTLLATGIDPCFTNLRTSLPSPDTVGNQWCVDGIQLDPASLQVTTTGSSDITFADADPDTITSAGVDFEALGFRAGNTINVAGTSNNDGNYTAIGVSGSVITLVSTDELTAEADTSAVLIGNTPYQVIKTIDGYRVFKSIYGDTFEAPPTTSSGDPDSVTINANVYNGGNIIFTADGEYTSLKSFDVGDSTTIEFAVTGIICNPDAADTITLNGTALSQGQALTSSGWGICTLDAPSADNAIRAICSGNIAGE